MTLITSKRIVAGIGEAGIERKADAKALLPLGC